MNKRVGILISGRGSNMVALLAEMRAGRLQAEPAIVISSNPEAAGVERARSFGVPVSVIPAKGRSREEHERELTATLEAAAVEIVCLAGYMRILSAEFVSRYTGRILNIHPSLLPAFPGLHPQRQALQGGVSVSGCTVHFVTPGVDAGPIAVQAAVPVLPDDDEARLSKRILDQEHRIYPLALQWLASGAMVLDRDRVRYRGVSLAAPSSLTWPAPSAVVRVPVSEN